MERKGFIMDPRDNVAVLPQAAAPGDSVICPGAGAYRVEEAVPAGHKLSIRAIPAGADIVKYGLTIGRASQEIPAGMWVHSHNVADITEEICSAFAAAYRESGEGAMG